MVYRPALVPSGSENEPSDRLCFFREANHALPRVAPETTSAELDNQRRARPLRVLPDVSGLSTVFMPGPSGSFLLKTATSSPHVTRLRGAFTQWLSSFDSAIAGCEKGFIYVDSTVIPLLRIS